MNEVARRVLQGTLEDMERAAERTRENLREHEAQVERLQGHLRDYELRIAGLREALGEEAQLAGAYWFKVGKVHLLDAGDYAAALCGLRTSFGSLELNIQGGPFRHDLLCATCLKVSETRPYWRD